MAINYTVSYTFSPSTTISSSQVNTNFSDNSNTWNGIEAKTKTFSNLGVDTELKSGGTIKSADGTHAAPGVTWTSDTTVGLARVSSQIAVIGHNAARYRRPVLQFGSTTTVAVESGLDGTSGNIPILFPDGSLRTETSTTRTTFNITRNAVLTTSGAQSGLTGATSEATNTWYALYAVKVTDSATLWVTIGSTVIPTQGNYSTLNTAYGTNGWVYLGMIRNGDNGGATGDILTFTQVGNHTRLKNVNTSYNIANSLGLLLATSASTTSLSYTYAAGTGTTNIPAHLTHVDYWAALVNSGGQQRIRDTAQAYDYSVASGGVSCAVLLTAADAAAGINVVPGTANKADIGLAGFWDGALGIGANPLL